MIFRSLAFILTLFAGMLSAPDVSAGTLVLGSVGENIKKHLVRFEPMAQYLQDELSGQGITAVQVAVLPSSDAMAQALRDGRVDLYFDSPLVAAKVARASDSEPFLRRWKKGISSYHSVIFVPADSDVRTVADLAGKRIAFQEPDSTSGFMLPAGLLRREGMALRELPSRSTQPRNDEVGYIFTKDDKNTLAWLYKGWVDAAATDPQNYEKLAHAKPGSVRVLARSIDVPRQVVIRRNGLEAGLADRIGAALVAMDQTEPGRSTLKRFNKTTRFDEFPDGVDATFSPIYDLLDELEAQGVL